MGQAQLTTPTALEPTVAADLSRRLDQKMAGLPWFKERVIELLLLLAAASSVLITVGIVLVLVTDASQFFLNNYDLSVPAVPEAQRAAVAEALVRDAGWGKEAADGLLAAGGGVVHYLQADDAEKIAKAYQAVGLTAAQTQVTLFKEFFTERTWTPDFANPKHGIWPLLAGTFMTTAIALLVAVPVGTICAVWLSEYAPPRLRESIKPTLELLAAVPTVVYGYFALLFVTPLLQKVVPGLGTFNMLSAGLVMGVMIVPYISSLSEDAMRAVPMHMREGSYAMGATKMQTAFRVIFPSALSGITAAYILGISRAVGETMVVAIAAGTKADLTFNPADEGATITAFIVRVSQGDAPHGSRQYNALYAAGLTLLVLTLVFNVAGYWLRKRYRQAY